VSTEIAKLQPNFYEAYGEATANRDIVGRLLLFSKFGEYNAGAEKEEIAIGTKLVGHMPSLLVGHVKWENNRPIARKMGAVGEGYVPDRNTLGDNDKSLWERYDDGRLRDPWQFTNYLVFVNLDTSDLFTFATSTQGGLGAIGELSKVYGKHIRQAPDELPLIELGCGSYQHSNRSYGEIRFPIFKIVGWLPSERLSHLVGNANDNVAVANDNKPAAIAAPAETITTAKDKAPAETVATPATKNKARF
jgi:hypothetical protein